jgi:hypothetical protein
VSSARDYPTKEELLKIKNWPPPDWKGLLEYVKTIWWMPQWGWDQAEDKYHVSTGGWSGNEELIGAMQENFLFWSMCWQSSHKGGHFAFKLPDSGGDRDRTQDNPKEPEGPETRAV